jgi:hypothetical protein
MELPHHNALHFPPQDVRFCAHRRPIRVDLQAETATEIFFGDPSCLCSLVFLGFLGFVHYICFASTL